MLFFSLNLFDLNLFFLIRADRICNIIKCRICNINGSDLRHHAIALMLHFCDIFTGVLISHFCNINGCFFGLDEGRMV